MKIFHVKGSVRGYDTFSSFVCIAASMKDAQETYPRAGCATWGGRFWVSTPDDDGDGSEYNPCGEWDTDLGSLSVDEIGKASPGSVPGVVCASFHAG